MKTPQELPNNLTQAELARHWGVHRTSVLRICQRYGYSGLKFGNRSAARRFEISEILKIEKIAGFSHPFEPSAHKGLKTTKPVKKNVLSALRLLLFDVIQLLISKKFRRSAK